jgi:predicted O-methyltransferase YrrM
MASAAGPGCHVDTIEGDFDHVKLAEHAFKERGFSNRISVLHGRGKALLPKLKRKYDVIFLDGDWFEYPGYLPQLRRLTRPGSILVTANLNPLFGGWGAKMPGKSSIQSYLTSLVRDPRFRTYIVPGEWHSISVRV